MTKKCLIKNINPLNGNLSATTSIEILVFRLCIAG
jgi:hypothetical protein